MRTALVTGASAGIGEAIARNLAARGYNLVLAARSRDALEALAGELAKTHNITASVEVCDLGDAQAPAKLVAAVASRGINIDMLVNNAGFGLNQRFWEGDMHRQLEMVQVNITALTELTHRMLPGMIARKRGQILNVASIAGFLPGPYQAVYFATKAFVVSLSAAINEELRASGHSVTVTALCPGPVPTKFASTAGFKSVSMFKGPAVLSAQAVAKIGIDAALKGKPIAVAGLINTLGVLATRIMSKPMAGRIAMRMQVPGK